MNTIHAGLGRWSRVGRHWGAAALLSLVACGGGVELGGTGTGSTIVGPVAGFGSIIVNGVRIDESSAAVRNADGDAVGRDAVKLGTVVEVSSGAISDDGAGNRTTTAQSVQIRSELRGPIQAVDLVAMRVTVLGQQVTITPSTVIEGGASSLAVGQVVEVHGALDVAAKRFVATRIEAALANASLRVRGVAQDVNPATARLTIAGQVYDLTQSGVPAGLADGVVVELRVEAVPRNGLWVVTKADVKDKRLPDREQAEVEGLVTAYTSAASFQVDGVVVDASRATVSGPAVALGLRVEVKGSSVGGVLQATSISVRKSDAGDNEPFDLRDKITSVNVAAQTLVLRGVTVFFGAPNVDFKDGTVADLKPDANVRVRGTLDTNGQRVVASRIQFLKD